MKIILFRRTNGEDILVNPHQIVSATQSGNGNQTMLTMTSIEGSTSSSGSNSKKIGVDHLLGEVHRMIDEALTAK
jgi:hypothetical protein